MTEAEMMDDLAAADAAGDTELAGAIADRIRAARAGPRPEPLASHARAPSEPLRASHKAPGEVPTAAATAMGFVQGLGMGWGDEALSGIGSVLPGYPVIGAPEGASIPERYRALKAYYRHLDQKSAEEHPVAYTGSKIAGGLMPTGAPVKLAKGGGALLRLGKAAGTGAGLGVVQGLGDSNGDSVGQMVNDAETGAAWGAGGGVAGHAIGALASKAAPLLRKAGTAMGYRHLRARGGDIAARVPLNDEAILAAYDAGAFRPGTTVHYAAQKLKDARARFGKQVGDLEDALAAAGVEGPDRAILAQEFEDAGNALKTHTSAGDPRMDQLKNEARDLRSEIPPPPAAPQPSGLLGPNGQPLPAPPAPPAPPSKLTLSEILDKKRSAQWAAEKEYDKLRGQMSATGEGKLAVAGKYKDASQQAIDAQGPLVAPDTHAQWSPTNKKFSHIASAEQVAEEGSARARGRYWLPIGVAAAGAAGGGVAGGDWESAMAGAAALHMLRTRGGSLGTSAALGGSRLASRMAPAIDNDLVKQIVLSAALNGRN